VDDRSTGVSELGRDVQPVTARQYLFPQPVLADPRERRVEGGLIDRARGQPQVADEASSPADAGQRVAEQQSSARVYAGSEKVTLAAPGRSTP